MLYAVTSDVDVRYFREQFVPFLIFLFLITFLLSFLGKLGKSRNYVIFRIFCEIFWVFNEGAILSISIEPMYFHLKSRSETTLRAIR